MADIRDNKRLLSQPHHDYDAVYPPSPPIPRNDFISKIKRKLQSFENPAYGTIKDDVPYVEMSSSPTIGWTNADVNANIQSEQRSGRSSRIYNGYRQQRACRLIAGVFIVCLIVAVVAGLLLHWLDLSDKQGASGTEITSTTHNPQTNHTAAVTNVLIGELRVTRGRFSNFNTEYKDSTSAPFLTFNASLCTAVEDVFLDSSDESMKSLHSSCSLATLQEGSVLATFRLLLSDVISITPHSVTPGVTHSIQHVTELFTTAMRRASMAVYVLDEFVIEKDSFRFKPGEAAVVPTDQTTQMTTTLSSTHPSSPPDVAGSTSAPPMCDPVEQFECRAGVLTLQHRRDYCIDLIEVCDGYMDCIEGEDESDCGTTCSNGGFRCRGHDATVMLLSSKCTWKDEQCDGIADCSDASDELNCPCAADEFQCTNGTDIHNGDFCVNLEYTCDRDPDCSDASDEHGCEYACEPDEFMCEERTIARPPFQGYCIMALEVCDGHSDCFDNSDETQERCTHCPPGKFRCENDTGDHSCILDSGRCDRTFDCEDHSDEKNCTYECGENDLACATGAISRWPYRGFCLHTEEKCNGVEECRDGSDELDCDKYQPCSEDEWRCKAGTDQSDGDFCIPDAYLCDRHVDCTDSSDEADPCMDICPAGLYSCVNGTIQLPDGQPGRGFCLKGHTRCDNITHCMDGSDEQDCDSCPEHTFQCTNGTSQHTSTGHRCIPIGFKCDRDPDCSDKSDESDCTYSCLDEQWMCETGMIAAWPFWGYCIHARERCDGLVDCKDESDERDCAIPCTEHQFQCVTGTDTTLQSRCIPDSEKCDRQYQCLDGSDEVGCTYECSPYEFACTANNAGEPHCISAELTCDGVEHCSDGSDEHAQCQCDDQQFRCHSGRHVQTGSPCIRLNMKCDHLTDCSDGSDEQNCTHSCPDGSFMCEEGVLDSTAFTDGGENRGFCVAMHWICDHTNHCIDGSDESPRTCDMKCETHQFRCVNGTDLYSTMRCLPLSFRCDRYVDCTDNSDEHGCEWECADDQWACETGIISRWPHKGYCIGQSERCDGHPDCQDHSDERNCNASEQCRHENEEAFACHNGTDVFHEDSCVPVRFRCDKVQDCSDDSDETGCDYQCEPGMIACSNGSIETEYTSRGFCLYPRHICDGEAQCLDKSDELNCEVTCQDDEFKCKTKGVGEMRDRCIPAKWRCDRAADCEDSSDEDDCTYSCTSDQFKCEFRSLARWPFYGFCVSSKDVCDNFKDCEDGSDEADCLGTENSCEDGAFRCAAEGTETGRFCIPMTHKCDRSYDCRDQSDEKYCQYTCPIGNFMCTTSAVIANMTDPANRKQGRGYCLEEFHRCDGINQCVDGTDESNCNDTCVGSEHTFRCDRGLNSHNVTACIPAWQKCDSITQCNDGSDEKDCKPNTCEQNQFLCKTKPLWYFKHAYHWCLDNSYVCDKFVDCGDFSDEVNCTYTACDAGTFKCGDPHGTLGSVCLPEEYVCNGENNCFSEVDEMGCDISCSLSSEISCHHGNAINGGQCIDINARCDGHVDCEDESDEAYCEIDQADLSDLISHAPDS